jgi:hypothetical protein
MLESNGFSPTDGEVESCELESLIGVLSSTACDSYWSRVATTVSVLCEPYKGLVVSCSKHRSDRKLLVSNLSKRIGILSMRGIATGGFTESLERLRGDTSDAVNVTYVMLDKSSEGSIWAYATNEYSTLLALFCIDRRG